MVAGKQQGEDRNAQSDCADFRKTHLVRAVAAVLGVDDELSKAQHHGLEAPAPGVDGLIAKVGQRNAHAIVVLLKAGNLRTTMIELRKRARSKQSDIIIASIDVTLDVNRKDTQFARKA